MENAESGRLPLETGGYLKKLNRSDLFYISRNGDMDIPIVNIAIYRLDVYRLLTLLLSDKLIANDNTFGALRNENFDNELIRLVLLVAVATRLLLEYIDGIDKKEKKNLNIDFKLKDNLCGHIWRNHQNLKFKDACSMVIHAKDIYIGPDKYFYNEYTDEEKSAKKKQKEYFKNKITITDRKKGRADIHLDKFAQYCVKLSNEISKRG